MLVLGLLAAIASAADEAPVAAPKSVTNTLGMTLVEVPAGAYLMGDKSADEINFHHRTSVTIGADLVNSRPAVDVEITKPFLLGAHEVTVGQFRKFVEATGYQTDAERSGRGAYVLHKIVKSEIDRFTPETDATWRKPGFPQDDNHPVVCVSWHDAVAFCEWLSKQEGKNYRLPLEAEWELACRAGSKTIYAGGNDPDTVYAYGNVADISLERELPDVVLRQRADHLGPNDGDGYVYTAPVGKFKANDFGLFDMHGNAWEWCQDRYQDRYYDTLQAEIRAKQKVRERGVVFDPRGPETTPQHKHGDWRGMRGGCWYTGPISCRSASRSYAEAGDAFSYAGFRVARDLP